MSKETFSMLLIPGGEIDGSLDGGPSCDMLQTSNSAGFNIHTSLIFRLLR